jgi:hypothetical protein
MSLNHAVGLLGRVLGSQDPLVREELLREFDDVVRGLDERSRAGKLGDILATAQNDFSYYEPQKDLREDRSLYGDDELDRRIRDVLVKLSEFGSASAGQV